jgi:hypothetical protein
MRAEEQECPCDAIKKEYMLQRTLDTWRLGIGPGKMVLGER